MGPTSTIPAEPSRARRIATTVLGGQILSLLITAAQLFNARLTEVLMPAGISVALSQTALFYITLLILFLPYFLARYGLNHLLSTLRTTWYVYLLLALFDFYANYTVTKAYGYTSSLSAFLLNSISTPLTVLISIVVFKAHYRVLHYAGMFICASGLAIIVWQDLTTTERLGTQTSSKGSNVAVGNILALVSGLGYALSTTTQEYTVKRLGGADDYCVMIGLFGTLISIIHMSIFERSEVVALLSISAEFVGPSVGMMSGFVISMLLLYIVTPRYLQKASATLFNVSILTANFFVLIGTILFLHNYHVNALYFVGFAAIILGLLLFNFDARSRNDIFSPSVTTTTDPIAMDGEMADKEQQIV